MLFLLFWLFVFMGWDVFFNLVCLLLFVGGLLCLYGIELDEVDVSFLFGECVGYLLVLGIMCVGKM